VKRNNEHATTMNEEQQARNNHGQGTTSEKAIDEEQQIRSNHE
jgi:hypothetical protein